MSAFPEAVVLFGAGGFVGRNIVDALRGRTHLVGVTATGSPVAGCDVTWPVDRLDEAPPLPAGTAIINVAAKRYVASRFAAEQADILSANMAVTEAVYRFAMARGITEVRAASSAAVYPADWAVLDDTRPLDLNAWPHPGEAAYGWSKRWAEIAAELWSRRASIHTVSLRLSNPYGPHDTLDEAEAHVATAFVIRAVQGAGPFAVRGDPDAERDFVFAGDVAAAFVESLSLTGVTQALNCALGHTTRVRELASAAMRAAGQDRPLALTPPPPGGFGGVKVRRATGGRLHELLPGLAPFRGLDEGLRLTMDWYRDALRR